MSAGKPITILIAEDQAITRFGLKCALETYPDLKVVAESGDGVSAILQALAVKPNVVLMDIGLPKVDGIRASKEIKQALPLTRIIMFTASAEDEHIYEALEVGADGYCLKTVAGEHLYSAIKAVTSGATWLDPGIANRLLRVQDSRHQQELAAPPVPLKLPNNTELSPEQVAVLKLLSSGSSLEEIARSTNMSLDRVGVLVQGTLGLLASAAKQELYTKGETPAHIESAHVVPKHSHLQQYDEGRTIIGDRYAIEGVLGQGGMGIVYKGRHVLMNRPVAIKMLHPEYADDKQVVSRFQSEAQTLSQLSHHNLVSVFDFGITTTHEPFLVMDFHSGQSLDSFLHENGPLGADLGIAIFTQVLEGLSVVHNAGIVHRDIKPSNIIVSQDKKLTVKIVDFGIAKSSSAEKAKLNLTNTGEVVGTPRYMSPEQCTNGELDARSDIYALGCVMYEAFTGRPTFDGDSFYEMVRQHVNEPASRLPFFQPEIRLPMNIVDAIFKALEKRPEDRFKSADEMREAMAKVTSAES